MIILQTVANLLKDSPGPVQNIQKMIHALSGATSVIEVSVDDILWGYEDDYLVLFDSLFPGLLPTTEFGIFQGVSYTHSPRRLFTGADDFTIINTLQAPACSLLDFVKFSST